MGKIKHGARYTKEYTAWVHMTQRCYNPNHKQFHNYGGRGIKVCDRWRNSFENFLADVGYAPSPKHSLDRYPNNDGNYEQPNVRWATSKQQSNNRRVTILVNGKNARQISIELGGDKTLVTKRLKRGWSLDKATSTPILL